MFGRDERESGMTRRIVERIEPVKNAFEADERRPKDADDHGQRAHRGERPQE